MNGSSQFEIFKDFAGRYRWRLWGPDKRITADSSESYPSVQAARLAARRIQTEAMTAEIIEKGSLPE